MNVKATVILSTLYLAIYTALTAANISENVILILFSVSPFVLIWLVYTILTDYKFKYPELRENEEWGYRDKAKDQLGIF